MISAGITGRGVRFSYFGVDQRYYGNQKCDDKQYYYTYL